MRYGSLIWLLLAHFLYRIGASSRPILFVLAIGFTFKLSGLGLTLLTLNGKNILSRKTYVNLLINYGLPVMPVIVHKQTVQMIVEMFNLKPATGTIMIFVAQVGVIVLVGAYEANPKT